VYRSSAWASAFRAGITLRRKRMSLLVLLAALLAPASSVVGAQEPDHTARHTTWCGSSSMADEFCLRAGSVSIAPPAGLGFRASHRARVVEPRSRVAVSAHGSARANFGREALCTFGVATEATVIVTRFGAMPNPLFWQEHGESQCTLARGARRKLALFCAQDPVANCPVVVSTRGTTQVITQTSNPATLEFCAGAFTIRVGVPGDFSEASGAVTGGGRVRAVITEHVSGGIETTPTGTRTVSNSEFGVKVMFVAGRGPCRASAFANQLARLGA
jgi:hypothetical protein